MNSEEIYTHREKGGSYTILHKTEIKIEGFWIPGYVYKSLDSGRIYTRSEKSFKENFKRWQ